MKRIGLLLLMITSLSGCVFGGSASVSVKPGYFFGHDLRQSASTVYVLDLSGSMSGQSGSIIEQAGTDVAGKVAGSLTVGFLGRGAGNAVENRIKKLKKKVEKVKLHLIASMSGLPDGSKFNVILFSNGVLKLSPGMILANAGNKTLVGLFVDRLEEGGSTNMHAALEAALLSGAEHIILLTDGMPTSSSPEAILQLARNQNSGQQFTISTVGVGVDQARGFLNQLAKENGGSFTAYD